MTVNIAVQKVSINFYSILTENSIFEEKIAGPKIEPKISDANNFSFQVTLATLAEELVIGLTLQYNKSVS